MRSRKALALIAEMCEAGDAQINAMLAADAYRLGDEILDRWVETGDPFYADAAERLGAIGAWLKNR